VAALIALATMPAMAPAADDAAALRAELQALKNDYNSRVDALEARIKQLETANARRPMRPWPGRGSATAPEPAPSGRAAGGASAFNPAISLILGGSFTGTSRSGGLGHRGLPPAGDEIGPG
jgi:hypothetical protein